MTCRVGSARMILNISSIRLTFRYQSFPVALYFACQWIPRRNRTIPVFPGLHHGSCRIFCFFSHFDMGSPARKSVQTFPNPLSGGCASWDSFFDIIQSLTAVGIDMTLISAIDRSPRPVLASATSTRSHCAESDRHSDGYAPQSGSMSPNSPLIDA